MGVLLGPSLFGLLLPQAQQYLFPKTATMLVNGVAQSSVHPSMAILYALSQVGLVLYMFIIGLQMEKSLLVKNSRDALMVSVSGVLLPCLLGGIVGYALVKDQRLFQLNLAPWQAALFVASAMSITAFPMLARILYEFGISRTRMGTLAIGAAAFDDAAAWCLLAAVIASVQQQPMVAIFAIGGGAIYSLITMTIGSRLFKWFEGSRERNGTITADAFAILITLLMFAAWFTDYIGIYSIFGAFVLGLSMPRGKFSAEVIQKVEPLTVSLLLPIFFVYSGLNVQLSLLLNPSLFLIAVVIITVAFVCKGVGCLFAAKLAGMTWKESAGIGILMNARGLMELILVNIAMEKGLISTGMYTILVIMAIITTLVASPLFGMLYKPVKEATNDSIGEKSAT